MTDGEGKFALQELDRTLIFQLLVVATDHVPLLTELEVDPLEELEPLALQPRDLGAEPPENVVRGVVRDVQGRPVPRARLAPLAQKLERGVRYGEVAADPLAVSEADGSFEFAAFAPGAEFQAEIEAAGFAKSMSGWLTAGGEDNVVVLHTGITLTGLIERDGKPVADFALGLTLEEQGAGVNLGTTSIATDAKGRFTFVNAPPDARLILYGELSNRGKGTLDQRPVTSGADGSTLDLGVLALEPGATLAGRVVVADGGELPEGAGLVLARDAVNDALVVEIGADGRFRVDSLPSDLLTLGVRLRYHHVSVRNASYDFVNHQGLIGRVPRDLELTLLLEPGPVQRTDPEFSKELWKRYQELCDAPLRGAPLEAAAPR